MELRVPYLRPQQVRDRLAAAPVVYVPVGPIEWHGPHLPFGTDPLHSEGLSLAACQQTGGLVWPTVFFGTERERPAKMLESLGLDGDSYVVGMDFPNNTLPSAYCPEEIFALVMREVLTEVGRMGAKVAVVVNGHGAVNQLSTLDRLTTEFNNTTDLKILTRKPLETFEDTVAASAGHADAWETSLMMHMYPGVVELGALPPVGTPIRYIDFAMVDGPAFDGQGGPEHVLQNDPRTQSSAKAGKTSFEAELKQLVRGVREALGELK